MTWDDFFGKLSKGLLIWLVYTLDFLCLLVWLIQIFPKLAINPIKLPLIWEGVGLIFGTIISFGATLLFVEDLD